MTNWLRILCLLVGALLLGCDTPKAGTAGDANDPVNTTDQEAIDPAAEAAANTPAE